MSVATGRLTAVPKPSLYLSLRIADLDELRKGNYEQSNPRELSDCVANSRSPVTIVATSVVITQIVHITGIILVIIHSPF